MIEQLSSLDITINSFLICAFTTRRMQEMPYGSPKESESLTKIAENLTRMNSNRTVKNKDAIGVTVPVTINFILEKLMTVSRRSSISGLP